MGKKRVPEHKRRGAGKPTKKPVVARRPVSASVVIVVGNRNNHDFINGEANNELRRIINRYALEEAQLKE
jgi:hypothetical protein